ncbi:hypothetical protein [Caballeronia sp. INDeC2]|uniref:hypothetical protein n=1 Tax=Caballeronia sp. INDeC2 TaxID=2921747 RepID=UPI0020278AB6|nr:hypothetical protein [Caballeronia sp. INDeC2]
MTISNLSIPYERISMAGGRLTTEPAGHHFDLSFRVEVRPRMLGRLSGEDIECPVLQWNERIEWFDYDTAAQAWRFVGENARDMYEHKPDSKTFRIWHSLRYLMATDDTNHPPAELKALQSDAQAKQWIARNGFAWNLAIRDIPSMAFAAARAAAEATASSQATRAGASSTSISGSRVTPSASAAYRFWKRNKGNSRSVT